MSKVLFINSIRQVFRNVPFVVNFYRYFFSNLPRNINKPALLVKSTQYKILNKLDTNSEIIFMLTLNEAHCVCSLPLYEKTLQSLLSQSYANWILIVSENIFVDLNCSDNRIVTVAHNPQLNNAYVGEVYAGDILHIHALKAFAHGAEQFADVMYSDHDFVDPSGVHFSPQYKPQWNSELAYSAVYTGNLTLYRFSLFNDLAHWLGFKSHYQRMLYWREVSTNKPKHLAYTLYHQLTDPSNLVDDSDLSVLNQHLMNQGASAENGLIEGSYKVNWPLPEQQPLVSIIIPTKNGLNLVKQCIETLYEKTTYCHFEVLLVDNQSDDQEALDYFNDLAKQQKVRLLQYDQPFNYSAINNFAIQHANGELLVLMNNDIEVISTDWLSEMVSQLLRPSVGCVGAKLYYPNDTIQHAGVILGLGRCAGHGHKHYKGNDHGYMNRLKLVQNYGAVTAACLGIRKTVFDEVKGLNEDALAVAYNDIDLCLKVRAAGYNNIWSPYIELYHHESVSRACDYEAEQYQRYLSELNYMQETWGVDNYIDPAYSPWLSMTTEDFSYAYPMYFYVK